MKQQSLFPGSDGKRKPKPSSEAAEKSDAAVVPKKRSNSRVTPEESVEGRAKAKGKSLYEEVRRTQNREEALAVVERIGKRAKQKKDERFNNLLSHLKVPLLKEAFLSLNQSASSGIDWVTWREYADGLDDRLSDLEGRIHRGGYRPLPVRRVFIPKGDGRMRPLGIPAIEDKIVQQAVRLVLEPIYEAEFVGFSYGFRPGRGPRRALDALYQGLTTRRVGWVLDADISAFFDSVDHAKLLGFLEDRISDRRMLALIARFLKAGVMTEEGFEETDAGTPQGGVLSPLLANVYLHHVVDRFVQRWRARCTSRTVIIVRYADDFVIGCHRAQDAKRLRTALEIRLRQHGLSLHPDKTRVIPFGRGAHRRSRGQDPGRPGSFDFLGLTHISHRTARLRWALVRVTSRKKRNQKLKELRREMRLRRHHPIADQHRWLCSVLRGHAAYYGVPGNFRVRRFCLEAERAWARSLQRRSQKATWDRARWMAFYRRYPLPLPVVDYAPCCRAVKREDR